MYKLNEGNINKRLLHPESSYYYYTDTSLVNPACILMVYNKATSRTYQLSNGF